MKLLWWMPCLFILFLSHSLRGAEPIHVKGEMQKVYVKGMDHYIDSTSKITFDEFINERDRLFASPQPLQGTRNRNFTYWMTFTLEGDVLKDENYYIICVDSRISHLRMWIDGVPGTEQPIGADYKFSNREISHRNFVHRLPKESNMEVVVSIRSDQSTFFSFEIKNEDKFLRDTGFEAGLLGSTYGFIVMAMLFSLFMLLKFRESIYVAYPAFAIVSLTIFLYLDGGGFFHIWNNVPELNLFLLLFLPIALMFSLGALVISVLEEWTLRSKYLRIILTAILIGQFGYIFVFTVPEYFIHNIFYMVPFLAMIYACILKYKSGFRALLAFIIGFVFVIFSNSLFMLQPFFAADYYHYLIQFSPHFGVVALTLAMSYSQFMKFYYINEARKSERKKSIHQLEQLNQIKDRINEEIEEKVAQQTKELEQKNAVIHIQNAELQHANDKLKAQTDEIVNLNLMLNQENQELKSDVEKMTESRILQNTISFEDFKQYFDSNEACYALLEELKWSDGFSCIKCGNTKYGSGKGERARRCTKCGTNASVTSNTIFHRIHFPLMKGFYMLFLVNKHGDKMISKELSEIVDLRLATCWKFSKKIKARKLEMEEEGIIVDSWIDLIS